MVNLSTYKKQVIEKEHLTYLTLCLTSLDVKKYHPLLQLYLCRFWDLIKNQPFTSAVAMRDMTSKVKQ